MLTSFVLVSLVFTSCETKTDSLKSLSLLHLTGTDGPASPGETVFSRPISIDTANRMIKSYLTSIDYTVNTAASRSWTISADTLRKYLSEGAGRHIVRLKIMLAHTLDYVNSGHEGQRPPLNSHDLTFVLVGVDEENNYIYNPESMAYDWAMPCPPDCLGGGTISSATHDTLVN